MLVAVLAVGTLAGCADKSNNGGDNSLTDSLSKIVEKIAEKNDNGIHAELKEIDLADKSEDGQWLIESTLGMKDVSKLKEAVVYEPMIGSIAFSMVMVRVNDPADAKDVADKMKGNIDPGKWVCVAADDIQAVTYGDVVMFIMVDSDLDVKTDGYVSAFQEICGGKLDYKAK